MKNKQCGYLDIKGGFHKTLFECNNENIAIEIRRIRSSIQYRIEAYAKRYAANFEAYYAPTSILTPDNYLASNVMERVFAELLLRNTHELLDFQKGITSLEKKWEELNDLRDTPRVLRKDWWFGKHIIFDEPIKLPDNE